MAHGVRQFVERRWLPTIRRPTDPTTSHSSGKAAFPVSSDGSVFPWPVLHGPGSFAPSNQRSSSTTVRAGVGAHPTPNSSVKRSSDGGRVWFSVEKRRVRGSRSPTSFRWRRKRDSAVRRGLAGPPEDRHGDIGNVTFRVIHSRRIIRRPITTIHL